jgi:phytoene dehydrogenase-like protein
MAGAPSPLVGLAESGEPLVLSSDLEQSRKSIAARSKGDAEKWEAFATQMDRLAGFLETLHSTEAVELMNPAASDMMALAGHGLRLRRMGKGDMVEMLRVLPMGVWDLLDDWFEGELLKGMVAATAMANLFQGPKSAGTGYSLLHHLAGREVGAFGSRRFPKSERGHLVNALAAALKKHGGETRVSTDAKVLVKDRRAVGVTLPGGETIAARAVVSGADPRRAFLKQLDPVNLAPEFVRPVQHVKLRGIRSVMLLALEAAPSFKNVSGDLAKGTLLVASSMERLERAFDAAKHGRIAEAPLLEITTPTLHDASLAPSGKHVVHVAMQFAPYRLRSSEGGWDDAARRKLEEVILGALEAHAPGIRSTIAGKQLFTPADLEREFALTEGNLYGGELTLDQILFMRPVPGFAHYETPVPGYYVCGDATHPGGGIAGLAGHHAAARIAKGLKR